MEEAMPIRPGDVLVPIDLSAMGGYLAMPWVPLRGALVLIQEIFGVTPAMRAIADDYASEGYAVLVPDIYWRLERNLNLGNGEDPQQREVAVHHAGRYDELQGTTDIVAAVEWLAASLELNARPAVLGFCLGGRMAVRVAAKADLACMVSMYGVGLDKLSAQIAHIACPVQFHFGENDNHNPPSIIEAVRESVRRRQRRDDEFFTYRDAEHAFYNRFRLDRFDEAAYQLARDRVLAFLQRHAQKAPSRPAA
jgi:carboxymethylenebutenolidase